MWLVGRISKYNPPTYHHHHHHHSSANDHELVARDHFNTAKDGYLSILRNSSCCLRSKTAMQLVDRYFAGDELMAQVPSPIYNN